MPAMKVMLIGATGVIGQAVAYALGPRHEVAAVSRRSDPRLDLADLESIAALFAAAGDADAVVCCAASAPLTPLESADFIPSVQAKLFGQVEVVRRALERLRDGQLGMHGSAGVPASEVARAYVEAVEGSMTGQVIGAGR
jgi:nucleoside-diphosphate-sugar epimerase